MILVERRPAKALARWDAEAEELAELGYDLAGPHHAPSWSGTYTPKAYAARAHYVRRWVGMTTEELARAHLNIQLACRVLA